MGVHGDGSTSTPHVPVSVTGGDYNSFYLTGTYNPNAAVRDDIRCLDIIPPVSDILEHFILTCNYRHLSRSVCGPVYHNSPLVYRCRARSYALIKISADRIAKVELQCFILHQLTLRLAIRL